MSKIWKYPRTFLFLEIKLFLNTAKTRIAALSHHQTCFERSWGTGTCSSSDKERGLPAGLRTEPTLSIKRWRTNLLLSRTLWRFDGENCADLSEDKNKYIFTAHLSVSQPITRPSGSLQSFVWSERLVWMIDTNIESLDITNINIVFSLRKKWYSQTIWERDLDRLIAVENSSVFYLNPIPWKTIISVILQVQLHWELFGTNGTFNGGVQSKVFLSKKKENQDRKISLFVSKTQRQTFAFLLDLKKKSRIIPDEKSFALGESANVESGSKLHQNDWTLNDNWDYFSEF